MTEEVKRGRGRPRSPNGPTPPVVRAARALAAVKEAGGRKLPVILTAEDSADLAYCREALDLPSDKATVVHAIKDLAKKLRRREG